MLFCLVCCIAPVAVASGKQCSRESAPTVSEAAAAALATVVIIIDDMGNNLPRGRAALALPGRLTFSVLPYSPFAATLAQQAHAAGKEVMLHAPMSNLRQIPPGPGGLTGDQSKRAFRTALDAALAQVPHVQGVNNHMGSDLTQRRRQMAWLMQAMRQHDLYFVDSRTTAKSVAAVVASEFRVPTISRQVFLDNERTEAAIDQRFAELLATARRKGTAVAIGHPYPETINYLARALPLLPARGVRLAFVSEVVADQRASASLASRTAMGAAAADEPWGSAHPGC